MRRRQEKEFRKQTRYARKLMVKRVKKNSGVGRLDAEIFHHLHLAFERRRRMALTNLRQQVT